MNNQTSLGLSGHQTINGLKPTKVRWKIFISMFVLATINYVDRTVLSIAMPTIQQDLHLDPAIVGVILSAFFWGYASMQFPSGFMLDKFRPDKIVVGSCIGWGIVQTLTGFVTGAKSLILLRVLLGVTEAPVFPAGAKLQSMWLTKKERARGATIIDSGAPFGAAIGGPVILAFLAILGGWRGALIGAGILTIVIGALVWPIIKGNPETNSRVNDAERIHIKTALTEEYEQVANDSKTSIGTKDYLKNRSFWAMCLGWFSFNTVFYGLLTWGPNYLAKTQHLNISAIGWSTLVIFGSGFVGELIGGFIADGWINRGGNPNTVMRTIFCTAGLMTSLSIFLLSKTPSVGMAIGLLATTLFFLRWAGMFWSVPATIAQRQHVGMVGASMNFSAQIAGIITPIYIGLIVKFTDSYFIALMVFVLAGLLLALSGSLINFNKKVGEV